LIGANPDLHLLDGSIEVTWSKR